MRPAAGDDEPPDWFLNPFTERRYPNADASWHLLPDFGEDFGDIKCIWEYSRWHWMFPLALRYRARGEMADLARLNAWLADWLDKNRPYRGPNWKCGQEASIRVMHLAVVALILEQVDAPEKALVETLALHLRRIRPTVSYAIGQDNNHATSEAAGLFIAGSLLARLGLREAREWEVQGRRLLERAADRLIGEAGSCSQYSLTYHRVILDTFAVSEAWRRRLDLAPFSDRLRARARAASDWLHHMIQPTSLAHSGREEAQDSRRRPRDQFKSRRLGWRRGTKMARWIRRSE